jgi:hypothetical protein
MGGHCRAYRRARQERHQSDRHRYDDRSALSFGERTWTAANTFATKYTVPFGSLTAAGTTDVTLVSLGASQVITKCLAKHTANFTGGALSA